MRVKVRRTLREELPGLAVLRDAAAAGLAGYPEGSGLLDLDPEADPDLAHLAAHDPDGFLTAVDRDETLGFAAAHLRSHQWVLSALWVLPQHRGRGAGEALLAKLLAYGERSGAKEYLAVVPVAAAIEAILLRHDFRPVSPVYLLRLDPARAATTAAALARLLPGQEVTSELLRRRGQADLDRIDRLTRGICREGDHVYWLRERRFKAAFVRQGERIAAYGYGGRERVGPVAGATQEAALSAIGQSLELARAAEPGASHRLWIPAPFVPALEALLDGGARLEATFGLYGRGLRQRFDRLALGPPVLP